MLGLGTYRCRAGVYEAVRAALLAGCRLIDTAPNYDSGRAQSQVGKALRETATAQPVTITTKVGFLPNPAARQEALADGVLTEDDLVNGHALVPAYLRWQLARTLDEFQRPRVDILYLHNPEEQRYRGDRRHLLTLIRDAFATCEDACARDRVGAYGVATWSGFGDAHLPPAFTVTELVQLADSLAGSAHHFRAVQTPISLVRIETVARAVHHGDGPLADCAEQGIAVQASAPLHGGELPALVNRQLARFIRPGMTPAQACLLFCASVPAVRAVLLSTSSLGHWREAARCVCAPLLSRAELSKVIHALQP